MFIFWSLKKIGILNLSMFLLHTQKPHQMSSFTIGFDILKFIEMSIKFQLSKLQYVQEFSVQHSFTKNIKFHLCL